jgi:SAM-dependent methyltransferase
MTDTVDFPERESWRGSFEQAAEQYDLARPRYPAEVFDDLVRISGLAPGDRLLEIGPGTGIATIEFAKRGFDVVAVELGVQLAQIARRNLAEFTGVEIVNGTFEEAQLSGLFSAVVSFAAFHWIDPAVRYPKSAKLLDNNGILATVDARHVLTSDADPFFLEVEDDYDAVLGEREHSPPPETRPGYAAEIEASGLFRMIEQRRYYWTIEYSADGYIALLDTFSGHRAIEPEKRRKLYRLIHDRIKRGRGSLAYTYEAILDIARISV